MSFSADPATSISVAPGGTATFDVTLTVNSLPYKGSFDADFVTAKRREHGDGAVRHRSAGTALTIRTSIAVSPGAGNSDAAHDRFSRACRIPQPDDPGRHLQHKHERGVG